MCPLATAIILALGVAQAAAGDVLADEVVQAQWGGSGSQGAAGSGAQGGSLGIGPTPVPRTPTPIPQTKPPGAAAIERDMDRGGRWGPPRMPDERPNKPPFRDDRDRFRDRPFIFFKDDDFDDDDDRNLLAPVEPAEPSEPEEASAPAEPPSPPDPRGPKFLPARGVAGEAPYAVGEPLPEGVPFVTLDWGRYALPEPPRGLIYARVGGDVLLIDPVTRMVQQRVDPAELETAEGAPDSG